MSLHIFINMSFKKNLINIATLCNICSFISILYLWHLDNALIALLLLCIFDDYALVVYFGVLIGRKKVASFWCLGVLMRLCAMACDPQNCLSLILYQRLYQRANFPRQPIMMPLCLAVLPCSLQQAFLSSVECCV